MTDEKVLHRIADQKGISLDEAASLWNHGMTPDERLHEQRSEAMENLTRDEAIATGHRTMVRAQEAFDKAEALHVRLEGTAVDIARAQYLQTRAQSFYTLAQTLPVA